MFDDLDYASVAALANAAARNIAHASIRDLELREAIYTTKLENGVRIGGYDIIRSVVDEEVLFNIQNQKREVLFCGLAYYDTARRITAMMNSGRSVSDQQIKRLVRQNGEFRRARDDARFYVMWLETNTEDNDEFRHNMTEDRLSQVTGKMKILRAQLLEPGRPYI